MKKDHPLIQAGLFLLMVFSFFLKNFQDYDTLVKFFAPDYLHAKSALKQLENRRPVHFNDEGGPILSKVFIRWFTEKNSARFPSDARVDEIHYAMITGFSGDITTMSLAVVISAPSAAPGKQRTLGWNLASAYQEIEKLKSKRISKVGFWLFIISAVLEAIFLWPKLRAHFKRAPKPIPQTSEYQSNASDSDCGSY